MTYHFDLDKFWRRMKERGLGTGTLAARAGVPPDAVQQLIALEEADEDVALKILEVLGREILAYDPDEVDSTAEADYPTEPLEATPPCDPSQYTIGKVKQLVASGAWGLEETLAAEQSQESPRSTLIDWLEKELAKESTSIT